MTSTLWQRALAGDPLDDCPIYDLHGHWGPFYGSSLPTGEESSQWIS